MKIRCRLATGRLIEAETEDGETIRELKLKISPEAGIAAESIRLVIKGKILTDSDIVPEMVDTDVIHVARMSTPVVTTPVVERARPERTFGADLLETPAIREMLSQPGLMRSVLANDPRFKQMVEANPEMESLLDDPQILTDMARAAQNPELMKEIMRNQDRALSNIESIPNGFTQLSSIYKSMGQDLITDDPSTPEADARMAKRLGIAERDKSKPNTSALPNPWARRPVAAPTLSSPMNMFSMMEQIQNAPSLGMVNSSIFPNLFSPSSSRPPLNPAPTSMMFNTPPVLPPIRPDPSVQERYASQLEQLKQMGFTNDEQNLAALLAAGGNTEAAIAYILDQ